MQGRFDCAILRFVNKAQGEISTMNSNILDTTKKVYELLAADQACTGQAKEVKLLADKLENRSLTVSVIGQFKRGKSTLSNAVLEDDILPVGIVPITSAVTKVLYGDKSAEVHFQNGVVEPVPFEKLSSYISEQENADNRLGVESVVLHTPSEFLKNGLIFVDTPGVGSFHKNNTEVAYQYMKESDAVIFLLSVDSPINQIEIDFLTNTKEFAGKFFFAVNKTDLVAECDLTAYMQYCEKLICQMMETDKATLIPVSARSGEGIEELKNTILRECRSKTLEILETSTEKKLKDLITRTLSQLDLYWKAMNMEYSELDARFAKITETIEALKAQAQAAEDSFEVQLNEMKLALSDKVMELFGMEYKYDIARLYQDAAAMSKDEFIEAVNALCEDLADTLNRILLYREENAYTVVRRINAINRLTRSLRKIRDGLCVEE